MKAPGTCQETAKSGERRHCGTHSTSWPTGTGVPLPKYTRNGSASEQELKFRAQKFTKGLSNHNRLTILQKMGWRQVLTVSVKS